VKNIRSKKRTQTVAIEVHRDKEGFSELYREILTGSGKEFCAWSNFESFESIINKDDDKKWTTERVKKGTRPRLVMIDNSTSRLFQASDSVYPRTTKLIKAGKNFSSTLVVSNGITYLFDDKPDVIALKIQHTGIAEKIQDIFDTYWSQL
jgi:sugar-specific transcriptional regulator TrmB